jgi:Mor family transcriptional regulator
MNTTQFIDERNSKLKEEYQKLRLDKSKNRDQNIKELAEKHNLSTSVVWEAIYRKANSKNIQA